MPVYFNKIYWLLLACAVNAVGCLSFGIPMETLPRGVRAPQLRFGVVNNLEQAYGSDQKLWSLSDQKSINFDAATLSQVNPDAKVLIRVLDAFGSQNLGKDINMGTLLVKTRPELSYQAMVFGYGVTDTWTLALGLPFMHYKNRTTLDSTEGNLNFYRAMFQGQSKDLDRALDIKIVPEAQKLIAAKGYMPLDDRDQKFIGDAQLVSMLRRSAFSWPVLFRFTLNLPTGPKDDPDDLLALNQFHRSALESFAALGVPIARRFMWKPFVSIKTPFPEKITKRVPVDENDTLPGVEQKEDIDRLIGVTGALGSEIEYNIDQRWSIQGLYQYSTKAKDSFRGERNSRYDLLEEKTESQAQAVRAELSYSTLQKYLAKESSIPMTMTFAWSDIIAGRNLNREQLNELSVMVLF